MFFSTRTMTSTSDYLQRIEHLRSVFANADKILIGAGAGLSAAAGLNYAGAEFEQHFRPWINRYGITDLYSSSFYPFKTEEELWAYWAMHIWFARYRRDAMPLYKRLLDIVKDRDYFVITTNVDGQFEKAGFDADRIFATQGDYALFQPKSGFQQVTWNNKEWVEKTLPHIADCRIPSELIPHVPDSNDKVAMNLRCDNSFVEDELWHRQCERYGDFLVQARGKRLLLLEFGVGFNTPVIIRFPFERMAAQNRQATLVRFNRDEIQPYYEGLERFLPFKEDIDKVLDAMPT